MTMKSSSSLFHSFACGVVSAIALGLAAPAIADDGNLILLFNSKDFDGWRKPTGDWQAVGAVRLDLADNKRFVIEPGAGVMVNGPKGRTVNLLTEREFGDIEAHIEFCLPKGSNSGIYFMGRYEIQVYDSHGVAKDKYPGIECGGIYPRWDAAQKRNYEGHSPRVNASKPPGEWQSFDVIFHAPRFDASGRKIENAKFVKVLHNGQVVHENVALTGPTRAAAFNDEKPFGPLMFQGDHGPLAYRNLRIKTVGQQ
ncbi:MAG: DUF1080 domain-containing protein [Verrucomicrobia bacterium]|nr:DUF1080 domain-containing protein [Verrucomicrobiota bacterium]